MEYTILPIAQLSSLQIKKLAQMHISVIPSLLSDLGAPLVEKYYQVARADASVLGFCALDEQGEPLGCVIGSPRPDRVNSQLRKPILWFVAQMVRVFFTRPSLIRQILISIRSLSERLSENSVELTYIGVDTSARSLGLGCALLGKFLQAATDATYQSVELSVETENQNALALYEKAGFRIINSFTEGYFKRYRLQWCPSL